MNIAEATAWRELVSRVTTLENEVKDLKRRADDQSKSQRVLADDVEKTKTLHLKRA